MRLIRLTAVGAAAAAAVAEGLPRGRRRRAAATPDRLLPTSRPHGAACRKGASVDEGRTDCGDAPQGGRQDKPAPALVFPRRSVA